MSLAPREIEGLGQGMRNWQARERFINSRHHQQKETEHESELG